MKKLIAVFFILLFTQLTFAETGKTCDRSAKLSKKLDLQEEQIEPVQQVMKQQHEKRREIMQANRDTVKLQMETLHNDTKAQLSSVLSPEQMIKFEELHTQRTEKMKQKRKEYFKTPAQITDNKPDDSI